MVKGASPFNNRKKELEIFHEKERNKFSQQIETGQAPVMVAQTC